MLGKVDWWNPKELRVRNFLLASLYGTPPQGHVFCFNHIHHFATLVGLHCDNTWGHHDAMGGAYIAALNVPADVLVIPGSHKTSFGTRPTKNIVPETVTLKPGQFIVMHPFLIHGGGAYKEGSICPYQLENNNNNWRGFGFVDAKVHLPIQKMCCNYVVIVSVEEPVDILQVPCQHGT